MSEVGVGAVLSQHAASDDRVHPCAFFSHRLSPAERNYDIGNRDLLAVKLALEEWRHWLEGSGVPFIVLTDHKNLEYIRTAKCLNSRQARWALFFGRFEFTLSYRPGSKNTKPVSLHPKSVCCRYCRTSRCSRRYVCGETRPGHQVPQRGEEVKSSTSSSGTLLGSPLGPVGLCSQ